MCWTVTRVEAPRRAQRGSNVLPPLPTVLMGVTFSGITLPLALWSQRCFRSLHVRALTNHAPLLAVAALECSSKKASSFPTAWHSVCRRRTDNAAASQQPLDGSPPCISDVCCHGYVSLRSPGCRRGAGDRLTACEGAQAMAQPKKSRAQPTLPEHPLVTAL